MTFERYKKELTKQIPERGRAFQIEARAKALLWEGVSEVMMS